MSRPLTPELAEFWLQDVLLGTLKNESRTTKKILEAVPAEKADHRPDPVSKTAMELVRHIAAAEIRFLETTINAEFPTSAGLPDSVKTPAEIAAWYSETFARNFEKLTQLKGEHLIKITDFRGMFKLPAVAFLQLGMSTLSTIAASSPATCAAWARKFPPSTAKASTTPKPARPRKPESACVFNWHLRPAC